MNLEYLKSIGVRNIEVHKNQGFMSKIFNGEYEGKKVIVHYTIPNEEQSYQEIKDKIIFVANLLSENGFPSSKILFSEELEDRSFILIQEMLPGKVFGKREYDGTQFLDSYDEKYHQEWMRTIKDLHQISLQGYGHIINGKGKYSSWKEFLEKESKRWADNIEFNKPKVMNENDREEIEAVNKMLHNHPLVKNVNSTFIHGDIVNPSNVLVEDNKITGILDFEWAMVGDPAWEFAFTNAPIEDYIKFADVEEKEFNERVKICRYFWLLWGTNVHAKGEFKGVLYDLFKKELDYWYKKI